MNNQSLQAALEHAIAVLCQQPGHEECLRAIEQAVSLWEQGPQEVTPESLERLGAGWIAEEALAISVYCALAAGVNFAAGVRLAVNHSGDSDSTGSITGNLLGTLLGMDAIPPDWLAMLELKAQIEQLAIDLVTINQDEPQ